MLIIVTVWDLFFHWDSFLSFLLHLKPSGEMKPQALLQDHSHALRVKHEGHVLHQYSSNQFNLLQSFKTLLPGLININHVKYFIYVKKCQPVAKDAVTKALIWLLPGLSLSIHRYTKTVKIFPILSSQVQLAHKICTYTFKTKKKSK